MTAPTVATVDDVELLGILDGALNALPDDPDAIAELLTRRGVKALCSSPTRCAIAVYLSARLPEGYCAVVGSVRAHVESAADEDWFGPDALLPPAVREFIERFDGGLYPELQQAKA